MLASNSVVFLYPRKDIRRANYKKQLEYGKKNPKKMADIIKAATMLSKIVKRLK